MGHGTGAEQMKNAPDASWLVELFVQYQETLDLQNHDRDSLRLKEALEDDRKLRSRPYRTASAAHTS